MALLAIPPTCPKCMGPLDPAVYSGGEKIDCRKCHRTVRSWAFPAIAKTEETALAEERLLEQDNSCFNHPQNKAIRICGSCGRFICALCDFTVGDGHLCPTCCQRGMDDIANAGQTLTSRKRYDGFCATLCVAQILALSVIFLPTFLFTIAIGYLTVRHWNAALEGPIPYSRIRFIVPLLISSAISAAYLFGAGFLLLR